MVESLLLVRSGSGTKSRGNIEYFHLKLALATIPELIGLLCIDKLSTIPSIARPKSTPVASIGVANQLNISQFSFARSTQLVDK